MIIANHIASTVKNAQASALQFSGLTRNQRKRAIQRLSELIQKNSKMWLAANRKDQKIYGAKLKPALYQRLILDEKKIRGLVKGTRQIAGLPEVLDKVTLQRSLVPGVVLKRIAVPIGVIAVIFESRPDVLPQILSLCLKTANVVLFKGGKETTNSNRAFMKIIVQLNRELKYLPKHWAQIIETREGMGELLKFDTAIDLVIPRGSGALVSHIMNSTNIPVLGHAEGICHTYVHSDADLKAALPVLLNAKLQHPSACNAMETLLVHPSVARKIIPPVALAVGKAKGIVFGCPKTLKLMRAHARANGYVLRPVKKWNHEHGNNNLSIRIVSGVDQAVEHIQTYGSKHTDAILTKNAKVAAHFQKRVDSAGVYVNASTRFADGFRYGFGAEVGVSTSKIGARGPVGLEGMVTYRYFINSKKSVTIDVLG